MSEPLDDLYDDGDDAPEDEFDYSDCGQLADGTCMNAGSEWCDFECPYS